MPRDRGFASDPLGRIRTQCRRVADLAVDVRVDRNRGFALAEELAPLCGLGAGLDMQHHFVGSPEETVAYFVTLDSINFGSGFFPLLHKSSSSGYYTIADSLTRWFRTAGVPAASDLARLRPADCAEIFGQDLTRPGVGRLMALFAHALRYLGQDLLTRFSGKASLLIRAADHSVARLIRLLQCQPFFRDVSSYRGFDVPFYKRAQIMASDLSLALDGQGLGRFDDIARCTIFADNLVPHVLRHEGVLLYSKSLSDRIGRGRRIPHHTRQEVEIRACAVDAVEGMGEYLRDGGRCVTPRQLDAVLWNRGQDPTIKSRPRHRTRTVCY